MDFHRVGNYALRVGLDESNCFHIGGWSAPLNNFLLHYNGDIYTPLFGWLSLYIPAQAAAASSGKLNHLDNSSWEFAYTGGPGGDSWRPIADGIWGGALALRNGAGGIDGPDATSPTQYVTKAQMENNAANKLINGGSLGTNYDMANSVNLASGIYGVEDVSGGANLPPGNDDYGQFLHLAARGDTRTQLFFPWNQAAVYYRNTYTSNGGTEAWNRFANANEIPTHNSQLINDAGYAPVANPAFTGVVTGPNTPTSLAAGDATTNGSFICRSGGSGDGELAGMTFYQDSYAMKMGVRHDGYFGIGGWSSTAWRWYSAPNGDMVAAGNVSAYSDPRLKENFQRIDDPLALLAALDGGTFTWKRGIPHIQGKAGQRDYGLLSDQVERVMPEIVSSSIAIDGETYRTECYEKLYPELIEAS
jgi:hypothetical protein